MAGTPESIQALKEAINGNDANAIKAWATPENRLDINAKIIVGSVVVPDEVKTTFHSTPSRVRIFPNYEDANTHSDKPTAVAHAESPLQYATRRGKVQAAKALIEVGADAAQALEEASRAGDEAAVRNLFAAGAKVTADLNEYTNAFVTDRSKFQSDLQKKRKLSEEELKQQREKQEKERSERHTLKSKTSEKSVPVVRGAQPQKLSSQETAAQELFAEVLAFCENAGKGKTQGKMELLSRCGSLGKKIDDFIKEDQKQEGKGKERGQQIETKSALWAEISRFLKILKNQHEIQEIQQACVDFLTRVALLPPSLRKIQQKLDDLISNVNNEGKKVQLRELRNEIDQLISTGTIVTPQALEILYTQVSSSHPNSITLSGIANWIKILRVSEDVFAMLTQFEDELRRVGLGELDKRYLSSFIDKQFLDFLQETLAQVQDGRIDSNSPEYRSLLTALHKLFQHNPELGGDKGIQFVRSILSKHSDPVERMKAVTEAINARFPNITPKPALQPTPKRASNPNSNPRPPLPGRPQGSRQEEDTDRKQFESSYKGDPKRFGEGYADFLKSKTSAPEITRGPRWKRRLVTQDDSDVQDRLRRRKGPKPLSQRINALDLAVPANQIINGRTTESDPLGWNSVRQRANVYSSFYYAMKRVYDRLKAGGFWYFSLPEMALFKKVRELLENKTYLQDLIIDGQTVWETLNPDDGSFRVVDLIEPEGKGQKSVLDEAIKQHTEHYYQDFKTVLSQEGGTYEPKDKNGEKKNYYFEKKEGRYHLMVRLGKTLSAAEKEEALRELLIITRDMENKIDVNVQLHTAVSAEEAKDLAVIITVLGATVDDPAHVAEKDKTAQMALAQPAAAMRETAIAPEFSMKSKKSRAESKKEPSELWATVRKVNSLEKENTVLDAIRKNQYRLMSPDGLRSMPEKADVKGAEKSRYWTKKSELLQSPDWDYVDAGDIITSVLRSVEREEDTTDGVVAHLTAFGEKPRENFSTETLRRSKTWLSDSDSESDLDDETLAPDREDETPGNEIPESRAQEQSTQNTQGDQGNSSSAPNAPVDGSPAPAANVPPPPPLPNLTAVQSDRQKVVKKLVGDRVTEKHQSMMAQLMEEIREKQGNSEQDKSVKSSSASSQPSSQSPDSMPPASFSAPPALQTQTQTFDTPSASSIPASAQSSAASPTDTDSSFEPQYFGVTVTDLPSAPVSPTPISPVDVSLAPASSRPDLPLYSSPQFIEASGIPSSEPQNVSENGSLNGAQNSNLTPPPPSPPPPLPPSSASTAVPKANSSATSDPTKQSTTHSSSSTSSSGKGKTASVGFSMDELKSKVESRAELTSPQNGQPAPDPRPNAPQAGKEPTTPATLMGDVRKGLESRFRSQQEGADEEEDWGLASTTSSSNTSSSSATSSSNSAPSPAPASFSAPTKSAIKPNESVTVNCDGNCLIHTVVMVLKRRFADLQSSDLDLSTTTGYAELEKAYQDKYGKGKSLEHFLHNSDQKVLEKVLSPILRVLAVKWLLEAQDFRKEIVKRIATAWKTTLVAALEADKPVDTVTTADLVQCVDIFPLGFQVDPAFIQQIRAEAFSPDAGEDNHKLINFINEVIFPELGNYYTKTTANLPLEVVTAAWRKLATNVELTHVHESSPDISPLLLGKKQGENVQVQLVQIAKTDGSGQTSHHYNVDIINAPRHEAKRNILPESKTVNSTKSLPAGESPLGAIFRSASKWTFLGDSSAPPSKSKTSPSQSMQKPKGNTVPRPTPMVSPSPIDKQPIVRLGPAASASTPTPTGMPGFSKKK